MTTKQIEIAAQADADVCNALDPPKIGAQAGGGIHVAISPDFAARIALGQEVPGCTYSHVESDGSLYVSPQVQAQIAIPAVVNGLTPQLQIESAALITKLAAAVVVSAQVASAQVAQQQDISTG